MEVATGTGLRVIALLLAMVCCGCQRASPGPQAAAEERPGPQTSQGTEPEEQDEEAELEIYILSDLGTLGGAASSAKDINNRGEIVGWAHTADGKRRAFLYREGAMIGLGTLAGGSYSEATAIGDNGQVAGFGGINEHGPGFEEFMNGFLWKAGTMQPLLPQYCPCTVNTHHGTSSAYGINNLEQAAGWTGTIRGDGVMHAALWKSPFEDKAGDIGAGAGDWEISRAFGINDSAEVAGDFAPEAGSTGIHERRAFLWKNGSRQDLGTLPGHSASTALAINRAGAVVGWSGSVDAGVARAFLWRDGGMRDLGTLHGATSSQALGINAQAQVVGWSGAAIVIDDSSAVSGRSDTSASVTARAFLWQQDQMLDLNEAIVLDVSEDLEIVYDWVFTEAAAINDAGQIAGTGFHNGEMRGFLLTPVRDLSVVLDIIF